MSGALHHGKRAYREAQVMSQVCDEKGIEFFDHVNGTCLSGTVRMERVNVLVERV